MQNELKSLSTFLQPVCVIMNSINQGIVLANALVLAFWVISWILALFHLDYWTDRERSLEGIRQEIAK